MLVLWSHREEKINANIEIGQDLHLNSLITSNQRNKNKIILGTINQVKPELN
jgi:hypothetical protein